MDGNPGTVTGLLRRWSGGDRAALDALMPLVYGELRALARRHMRAERREHTLETAALVHEAYVRLVGSEVAWSDRAHFFVIASRAMRRVLVDHARTRASAKRGGAVETIRVGATLDVPGGTEPEIGELDEALRRLEAAEPRKAQVVELRFFGGLGHDEIARVLGLARSTVRRDDRFARAWLRAALETPRGRPT